MGTEIYYPRPLSKAAWFSRDRVLAQDGVVRLSDEGVADIVGRLHDGPLHEPLALEDLLAEQPRLRAVDVPDLLGAASRKCP